MFRVFPWSGRTGRVALRRQYFPIHSGWLRSIRPFGPYPLSRGVPAHPSHWYGSVTGENYIHWIWFHYLRAGIDLAIYYLCGIVNLHDTSSWKQWCSIAKLNYRMDSSGNLKLGITLLYRTCVILLLHSGCVRACRWSYRSRPRYHLRPFGRHHCAFQTG